jgi:RHS repeat-associated protein
MLSHKLIQIKAGTTANPTLLLDLRYYSGANTPKGVYPERMRRNPVGKILNIYDYAFGDFKHRQRSMGSPQTQTFTYDNLDRLTSAQATGGTNGNYASESYTYNTTTGNLASKAGISYTYGDSNHAHAVTSLSNGNTYSYDAGFAVGKHGNQVTRYVGGSTYTLTYDAENRLVSVSGAVTASFVFDGDGNRVKSTIASTTTTFVGTYYEVTGSSITKYYYAGTNRIALRNSSGVRYIFGDHLGSTSITADGSGGNMIRQLYKAWGEIRYSSGSLPTKYTYTGQYSYASGGEIGLLYYVARFYDPYLNRWISPDVIIPDPSNSIDLDRYAYARNNSLRYSDSTGHWTEDELEQALGKDWEIKYFGEEGVYYGRDKLRAFLLSKNTTDPLTLEIIRKLFNSSYDTHSVGLDFSMLDALGARFSLTGGIGGFGGGSVDIVLNLNSGEFSVFGSPEGGLAIGETATIVGGITLYKYCPSNDDFRGTAKSVGVMGGNIVGINIEKNWGGVHRFQSSSEVMDGSFIGVGGAVPGVSVYGSLSFAFEGLRVDQVGYHWFPYVPGPIDILSDLGEVIWNDILHLP